MTAVTTLLTRQATLLQRSPGAADELGDPTWIEVGVPVECELQPSGANEAHGDALQVSTWRLFLGPEHATASGWDAVEVGGELFELVGDPAPIWNPRALAYDHVEATVQRVR